MNKFFSLIFLLGTMLAPSLTTNSQTPEPPIFFDGFLLDNAGQPADNYNGFFLWNVTDGSVDLIGGNVPGMDDPAMGGRYVDLGGSTNDPGAFATKTALPFVAGITYNLSFNYNSVDGQTNTATATIGSQVFNITATSTAFQRFSQNFTFSNATTANLVFQDLGSDNSGVGIDTVQVSIALPPTAAGTTAGGRVTEANGRGIFRALITTTDSQGNQRQAFTNQLGYYNFENVPGGQVYVFTAQHRRYLFDQPTQVQFIGEDEDGINFIGTTNGFFRYDPWNLPIKGV